MFEQTLIDSGVEILQSESFQTGESDFTAQLTRIKDAGPDAIFLSAQQIETILIFKQARTIGIAADVPFITVSLSAEDIESTEGAGEEAITFAPWSSSADTPGNQAFVEKYRARYGRAPRPMVCAGACHGAYPSRSHRECRIAGFRRNPRRFGEYQQS